MKSEVIIGIVIKGTNVLIVKRKEGEGNLRWQFPGGCPENQETEEQTLIRELYEETGCCIRPIKLIEQKLHPYTKKIISYWACQYISGDLCVNDDDLEEARWVEKYELNNYFTTSINEAGLKYLNG